MKVIQWKSGEFEVTTDRTRLEIETIHNFLALESGWAKGIPRQIVERSIEGSLCFGLFHRNRQVGFARVITDCATIAYLGDVFVLKDYRGRGLAKWLMECVVAILAFKISDVGFWSRPMRTTCIGNMGLRPSPGRRVSWSLMIPMSTESTNLDVVQIQPATELDMEQSPRFCVTHFSNSNLFIPKPPMRKRRRIPTRCVAVYTKVRSGLQDGAAKSWERSQALRNRTAYMFAARLSFRPLAETGLPGCF
jgi:Acetyltransferase (GNAT) domain